MPRPLRRAQAGVIYHVLNRGNGRQVLFNKDGDYDDFVALLAKAMERYPVELLAWCLMNNHWHLLLRPRTDDALPRMMGWLATTHARRHHAHRRTPAGGHLYQGRYKSFPVQDDGHFLTVARYVHANPLRARLVDRAQQWTWSSITRRAQHPPIADWPIDRPRNWPSLVNGLPESEAAQVRTSIERGRPFGSEKWTHTIATRLNLQNTLVPLGRPRKPLEALSPRQKRRRAKEDGTKVRMTP